MINYDTLIKDIKMDSTNVEDQLIPGVVNDKLFDFLICQKFLFFSVKRLNQVTHNEDKLCCWTSQLEHDVRLSAIGSVQMAIQTFLPSTNVDMKLVETICMRYFDYFTAKMRRDRNRIEELMNDEN